ncbi:MAG TPA: MFS transporter [Solirubrobacteraceae bacterium]|jgi:CP family cyanate transporter-like MFS transporter
MLLLGIVLIAANMRASITAVGPLLSEITRAYGLSGTEAGLLTAAPVLCFAAFSPYAPRLSRRVGMENALLAAMVALLAGIVVRSLPSAFTLFAGTVVLAAGVAMANVLLPALVKQHFSARQSSVTALYANTMGFVAAIASGVAVPLADVLPGGWRVSLGAWSVLVVAGLVLWLPRVWDRQDPGPTQRHTPLPWRSRVAWQVTAFMGLQSFGFYVMIGWLPSFLRSHHVSARGAGFELLAYQLAAIVATLSLPLMADRRRDHRAPAAAAAACCATGYVGLLVAPHLSLLWVVLAGCGSGPALVFALSFMALRASGPGHAAALSAMAQSAGYLIAAAGPFMFGALHALTGSWTLSLVALLASAVGFFGFSFSAGAPEARV